MPARYALYFAPQPSSPLARFGSAWLGRDAWTDKSLPQFKVDDLTTDDLERITATPRHYGFHATLKPPFFLASGHNEDDLHEAAARFAENRKVFPVPPLTLISLDGFLALAPNQRSPGLELLAADCVTEFDRFQAPLSPQELAKRRSTGLSERQEELLQRWGYPYVMDQFRFHFTLTDRLEKAERRTLAAILQPLVEPFTLESLSINGVTIFFQPDLEKPFQVLQRYPFVG